ncbi:hypothetical protein J5X84_42140 [Streptosporangiaceae bacterium NEAU-GS5]|nr:hypothetical protein [Streptosporangiaceae bacterium NEAU-GS5]
MQRAVVSSVRPLARCLLSYLPVLMVAVGTGLRALAGPLWALALVAAVLAIGALVLTLRRRRRPGGRIDWDSAAPYEQAIRAQISPRILTVLDETAAWIGRLGYRIHVYRMECTCGHDGSACSCRQRWFAGTAPMPGRRVVLLVGDRLLEAEADVLRFVMVHERTHVSTVWFAAARARILVVSLAAVAAGILSSGMTVLLAAAGLLLVWMVWAWVIELACDLNAARCHGAAAPQLWAMYTEAGALSRAGLRWWQRTIRLSTLPDHPPVWLRARLCRATHQRRLETP